MQKFLIYIAHPYSIPIGRPLDAEIKKRGFEAKWFVEIEATKSKLSKNENLLNTVDEVINYKPDVVLVAANEVPHFFPGIKVQVFHGFSVNKRNKDKGHFRIRGFFDLYCTQGPSTTTYFKKLEKKYGFFKVVETGWSKVDVLFPKTESKKDSKPTLFLASTFTTSLSLAHNNEVYNVIKKLIENNEWNWIINLHPKMDAEIVQKFKQLEQYDNVTYIPFLDSLLPLKNADVLIADTSSIITEFMIQEKPVVTFNNNKPFDYFINTLEAKDLEKNIRLALSKPKELMNKISVFINNEHPYFDGKSSERIINASLDFLNSKTNTKLKKKPLNLIRKFKMRRKFNYFKNFFKSN
uniref:UDP-N-acetylglucosamine 2-epimerase n=1 Tax=Flavobacterium sp. TaxID=239 RepID=UPI004049DAE9